MLLRSLVDDVCRLFDGTIEPHRFTHFGFLTVPVAHDILPCVGVREGEFVWCDADDVSIAFVEIEHVKWESPVYCTVEVWNSRNGVGSWAGETAQWVEVEIVNGCGDGIKYRLVLLARSTTFGVE